MKKLLSLCLLLSFTAYGEPVMLQWNLVKSDRIEILKTAEVEEFLNGAQIDRHSERNITDLTCTQSNSSEFVVDGLFTVYVRKDNASVFKKIDQKNALFSIKKSGVFHVPKGTLMPNLRNIPAFPNKKVEIGETWSSTGVIIIDSFSKPFSLEMPVEYTLKKIAIEKGDHIAYIHYNYLINRTFSKGSVPNDFPAKIAAKDKGVIRWNITKNEPFDAINHYHALFIFEQNNSLATYEWKMVVKTENRVYPHTPEKEQDDAKGAIQDELKESRGITVDKNDTGIVIRLGEVLFDFDSDTVKPETQEILNDVLAIINNNYSDREIVVEGHTDNTGNARYNQKLSEKRASKVAEAIQKGIDHDKVSYAGHGEAKPVADNTTKKGREQNRRVDIIIKLN